MYQLGINPVTAEAHTMSLALGANRWASRVVVVLQLAAWSAVGIVLLQKGVSSLQKTAAIQEARNGTKVNFTETVANLAMKELPTDDRLLSQITEEPLHPPRTIPLPDIGEDLSSEDRDDAEPRPVVPVDSSPVLLTPNHLSSDKKSPRKTQNPLDSDERLRSASTESASEKSAESISASVKYDKVFETKKKVKIQANLNGGGAAAAAVAMVAVGAVMLVLGPAVIILRALDERRQERRFLKLSGQDDLPPSYEQATLMDEAPRYSTLSLNTISCSSAAVAGTSSSAGRISQEDPEARVFEV